MTAITHTFRFSGAGEDFGPRADGIVTLHTWESSPTANRVADMMDDLRWQDGDNIAGSYNRVVCVDGVISSVPDHHASGGINPGSSFWAPKAWLFDVLDRDVIANPNYFTLNLAAAGQRLYYDMYGWPPGIIDGFARSILDEEKRIGRPVVITNHADFQSNRSDAGDKARELVKQRLAQLKSGDDMPALTRYALERVTLDAEARVRSEPSNGPVTRSMLTGDETRPVSIGEVVNADGPWTVYWVTRWEAWGYTRSDLNVLAREPHTGQIEVIKEVPTGLTQKDVDAAVAALNAKLDTWAAARPR